jgi:hypothetical protein
VATRTKIGRNRAFIACMRAHTARDRARSDQFGPIFQKEKIMRHHPNPRAEILVSPEVHQHLLSAVVDSRFEKECWEIAAEAIEEWVRRHNPDDIGMPATRGYQWKNLFLPDGTLLRTVFGGKNHHCMVETDSILYNGQAVSPSGVVNAVGGIRRNAWRCIWVLLPDNKEWKLADAMRTRSRPRRQRKLTQAATPATGGQSCAGGAPADLAQVPAQMSPPAEPTAVRASDQSCAQACGPDSVQRTGSNSATHGGGRGSCTSLFSPHCRRGAERRFSERRRVNRQR